MSTDYRLHGFTMQPMEDFFSQRVGCFHFQGTPKRASCKMAYGWCNSWQIPCGAAVSKLDWTFEKCRVLLGYASCRDPVVEILPGRGLDNAGWFRHTNSTADRSTMREHKTYENNAE